MLYTSGADDNADDNGDVNDGGNGVVLIRRVMVIFDWSCSSRCSPSDATCYTAAPPPLERRQARCVQYATLDIFHFPNREISVRFNAFKQGKHEH